MTKEFTYFDTCIWCGCAVDTREVEDGGSPEGCELVSGSWACSDTCYYKATGWKDEE